MKIVHIEDFFHPNAGYQINLLAKYMSKLGHDITIITSEIAKIPESLTNFFGKDNLQEDDESYSRNFNVKIIRVPIFNYVSGRSIYNLRKLNKLVMNENPDVLYVHGNDTYVGIYYSLKANKLPFPIIMDSHMLEMASNNKLNKQFRKFYQKYITPSIIENEIPIIRTQDDPYVQDALGIPLSQSPWISTGADLMNFHPDSTTKIMLRKKMGISEDDFVVIYTGKLGDSKGGKLLANTFKEKFDTNKDVTLIAVGNTTGVYGQEVESIFQKSKNNIIRIETQPYLKLAELYQTADLSIFPKQVSLSFYDAQACGLPVVSESNNINDERVSHNNGETYEKDNDLDFKKKIEKFINMDLNRFKIYSNNAYKYVKENYDYELITKEYINIIEEEYNKFHARS